MKAIYDIRQQIPQFAANFFAPYDRTDPKNDYPKMMTHRDGGGKLKPYLDAAKKPVIVQDEHEEKLFLAKHYKTEAEPVAQAIEVLVAAPVAKPVERHQFEAITPAEAAKAEKPAKRKYTRKLSA